MKLNKGIVKGEIRKFMVKDEIIKVLKELKFPKDEYYVLGGSALVLYGIREKTKDVDLCISNKLFRIIKDKYSLTDKTKNVCGFYKISDIVEAVPNNKKNFMMLKYDDYNRQDLYQMYMNKKLSAREKDLLDMERIKAYILYTTDEKILKTMDERKLIDMDIIN